MGQLFTLTTQPIRVSADGFQPLDLTLDISAFDILDVHLGIIAIEGTASPTVTVELWTAATIAQDLNTTTSRGFALLHSFGSMSAIGWSKVNLPAAASVSGVGLMRFLRWKATLTGTTPAATFFLRGIGRSYSGSP